MGMLYEQPMRTIVDARISASGEPQQLMAPTYWVSGNDNEGHVFQPNLREAVWGPITKREMTDE